MKICILGDSLSLLSGHSKPAFELSSELTKHGFEVFLITNRLDPEIQKKHALLADQYPDLKNVTIIELAHFSHKLLNSSEMLRLFSDCDFFHFFTPSLRVISKFIKRYPGRVIWQITGDYIAIRDFWACGFSTYTGFFKYNPSKLWNILHKYAYKKVADKCKAVVCSTSYMHDRLCQLGLNCSNMVCLPFGVYPNPKPVNSLQSGDEIVYMYFGWLSPIRGFTDLLRAFDQVYAQNRNARLLIANPGGHPEETAMLSLIHDCASRHAIMIHPWQDDMNGMLLNSDVVVLPFRGNYGYSQPPLVVLEALNASKPVISTTVGCINEFISDQNNGLLVPPSNVESLTRAMLFMSDRQKCQAFGQNAYDRIQEKCWNHVAQHYLNIYNL